MDERYDCYMIIEAVDKDGGTVSEHYFKLRCDLIPFLEDIKVVWEKHHPGEKISVSSRSSL